MASWVVPLMAQVLLFALIMGMAASVDTQILRDRFRKWHGIALGILLQFSVLPLAGFCSAKLFDLEDVFGITLIVVTASPGGAYSNWWCSLFNADLALSVAMTTCSTLVSIMLTPLNLVLYTKAAYGEAPKLDWLQLMSSIGIAASAIVCGVLVSVRLPRRRSTFNLLGNIAGLCLIIFSASVSSTDDPIWDKDSKFYAAVAAPCFLGVASSFLLGYAAPCIAKPEAVAVTVETAYQNTGLALTIALATFDEENRGRAAGVPIYYGVVQVVLLPLFLLFAWKSGLTYAPRSEWLCRVLVGDYQPRLGVNVQVAPVPGAAGHPKADGEVPTQPEATEAPPNMISPKRRRRANGDGDAAESDRSDSSYTSAAQENGRPNSRVGQVQDSQEILEDVEDVVDLQPRPANPTTSASITPLDSLASVECEAAQVPGTLITPENEGADGRKIARLASPADDRVVGTESMAVNLANTQADFLELGGQAAVHSPVQSMPLRGRESRSSIVDTATAVVPSEKVGSSEAGAPTRKVSGPDDLASTS